MTDFERQLSELEVAHKQLELEKMRAEIAQTSLAWWKRPGYLGSLSPLLLALVGVGTAWITGYFDTQRQNLATEIAALEAEKAALETSLEDTQRAIDMGYLQMRLASDDASYALSLFGAFNEEMNAANETILEYQSELPADVLGAMNTVFDLKAERFNIVQIASESIDDLQVRLDEIDASPWAKGLQSDPFLSSLGLLINEDEQYFDIRQGRFLAPEEVPEGVN